jgi:manganese transport protein
MFGLPTTGTPPFCPSEVRGSVAVDRGAPFWRRLLVFLGPGLLISVGYVDPGNWATDIEAGSKLGFGLLWVVLLASLAAMPLQTLSLKLGIVARKDLARACREHYGPRVNTALWLLAELAIVACDVAEVLGAALALHLLFGMPLLAAVAITAFDMLIVLGLKGHGFRQVEAVILGLMATIGACFAVELALVGPDWTVVGRGFIPHPASLRETGSLYLAIGILGATVMPHNLYLHSSIVQTRQVALDHESRRDALRLATFDTVASLSLALLVNAAILILAAEAFHSSGHQNVAEIQDAYHLLDPLVGSTAASLLFGIALLAAGQSSTFTGTIAGQILLEGFLDLKIACWKRRLITRTLALIPALLGVAWLGEGGVGQLLVASQVVLSLQLPFAIWPLIRFTSDRRWMGDAFVNSATLKWVVWGLFVIITGANLALLASLLPCK